ncbi:hypothetical protein EJ03DRAFT_363193 [Teratosphaeria nubilosa]|uniref:ATP-grasp domain-containing protein n=1 Tax=Teratosphaeria nubilosa TaxID=161662 RepID=A0A6G1L976_9PEZI|nr:hypothetical protein EJ03DRAFT_363193 [Teratosphaeria nubilosa]
MVCGFRRKGALPGHRRLRVLLTNGRFPVSLDLARQLRKAGHQVFVVDPMEYHVCAFSITVKSSMQVPAPHDDAKGYAQGVLTAIEKWQIDQIIPIHEEIFFLAECGEPAILERLFAPPFALLVRLHNKWEFTKMMQRLGMDVPEAQLCRNYDDVERLNLEKYKHGMALKPCFGRACSGIYRLESSEPLPESTDLNIGNHNHYIAQEWIKGTRYCSYSVVREGRVEATSLYPVTDTIDGSSCVYFEQKYHEGIYNYILEFVRRCSEIEGPFSGQLAFDFVEDLENNRLVTIECNPRSTSGIHLWTRTPYLAYVLTNSIPEVRREEKPIQPPPTPIWHEPSHAQVAAGMIMWEHKDATLSVWAHHMARLVGTRDVVWAWRDPMPVIAEPFLLTTYFTMARKAGLQLPELFQHQVIWSPQGTHLEQVRKIIDDADARDEEMARRMSSEFENVLTSQMDVIAPCAPVGDSIGSALEKMAEHFTGEECPMLDRKTPQPDVNSATMRDSAISEAGIEVPGQQAVDGAAAEKQQE